MSVDILFDDHPDPAWIVRRGTDRILAANKAACAVFGIPSGDFVGQDLPALPAASASSVHDPLETGKRHAGGLRRGDTQWKGKPAEIVIAPSLGAAQAPTGPDHAPASDTPFDWQEVLALGQFAPWHYDVAEDRLVWSGEMHAMMGVPPEEFGGTLDDFYRRVHPEDLPAIKAERAAAARKGRVLDTVHRIVRPDGEVRHIRQIAREWDGPDGPIRRGLCQDVTAFREAENEKRMVETLLMIAGEAAGIGGWRYEPATDQVTWTTGMVSLHGAEPGWVPKNTAEALEFYLPQDRERIAMAVERCARDGITFDEICRLRAADGQLKWVRTIGQPDRAPSGEIIGVVGALQDISELTEAQRESETLSRRLRDTLGRISEGFLLLNRDFSYAYVNPEAEKLLGFSLAELEGRKIWDVFADAQEILKERFLRAMADGEAVTLEFYHTDKQAWFRTKLHPTTEGLAIYLVDFTEERARNEALRLLESAVSYVNDIIIITEGGVIDAPEGPRIIWVNDAFERVTGYSREEAIGQTPRMLQGPKTQRAELDRIRAALSRNDPVRAELINHHRDGTPFWLDIDIVPLVGDGGAIQHFIAVQRDITRRKKVEDALSASEARFQLVAQAANDVIFDYDVEKDEVWWSDALRTVFGHDPIEADGSLESWSQFLHPDDREASTASIREAFNGDADSWVGEYRFQRSDGSYAHVVDRGLILRDGAGKAMRWVGSMIDVTALRASEERFRLAAKAAHDVIYSYDFITDEHWSSEALFTHYGHDRPNGVGNFASWAALIHPEDRQRILDSHREATDGDKETWTGIYRFMRADGSHAHVIDRAYLLRDGAGRAVQSIGSLVDVTSMRENELRLRAMAEVAADTVYDFDPQCGEVYFSEGIRNVFGHEWSGLQTVPTPWTDCVHPDDLPRVSDALRQFIAGATDRLKQEYRLRRGDGRYAIVEENAVALRDADGRALRVIASLRDITKEREMAEQLRQAQRLEAIGQLTGGVAHDFNNLLTIIMGNAEALADDDELSQPDREMAQSILTAAERGAELTNSLLAFARRQPLAPRPLDMRALFDELGRLLARTLSANVEIRTEIAPDLWLAEADPSQLTTALINLALNARDAMPTGGRLTVACANVQLDGGQSAGDPVPGDYIAVSVSDTGDGMTRDVRERAFDPFFTTKGPGRGSGMGLSMVYGFARQSGGHAHIHSEPGKGTSVTIYLPRSHAKRPADVALDETTEAPTGAGEYVLVVEDDPALRSHVCELISGLGYRVSCAGSSDEAQQILDVSPGISVLFTDVVMPGPLDGYGLAKLARRRNPGLRILFTSGYADSSLLEGERLEHGVHLLSKPYRRQDLARKLREVLTEGGTAETGDGGHNGTTKPHLRRKRR